MNQVNTKELPRAIKKLGEHLDDAMAHLYNVEGLPAERKDIVREHLWRAWEIVKEAIQ